MAARFVVGGHEAATHRGDAVPHGIPTPWRAWGWSLLAIALAATLTVAWSSSARQLSPSTLVSLDLLLETFSVAIALSISLLTWSTREAQPPHFAFAGLAFLATAVLGAAQLVISPKMLGLALRHDARSWIVLRMGAGSAAAVGLLVASLGPSARNRVRTLRVGIVVTWTAVAATILLASVAPDWPRAIEQAAARVELVAALVALAAAAQAFRRYRGGQVGFGPLALASMLIAVGMAFEAALVPEDASMALAGATCKAIGGLLVYRALFREGVLMPWRRRVKSGLAVEEDRQRYRQLFESAPDGLLLVDAAATIVEVNPSAAAMFGWSIPEMTGRPVEELIPHRLRAEHERARARFLAEPRARAMGYGGALHATRRDGASFPVEIALVPQEFGGGRTTLCIVRDVTERHHLEQSLMKQALHDALTDLPNRRHFWDSVTKALAHAEHHGGTLAVLFIDLDNFKQVNDTLGHSHGDNLLRQVAHRLSAALRAGDLLARMGGDEFALLLIGAEAEDAAAVAEKALRVLGPHFHHAGQAMKVGASIGITMFPTDGRSVEDLLSHADLAMYNAKARGRSTWRFFEPGMTEGAWARSSLQQDLAYAIERGQFELEFQPRVRATDGVLTGFESLLRWRHPERGNVPPDVFISLAEESGQIVPIGEWVLRESCAQAARWRAVGGADLTMAVNVSTHQLRHPGFAAEVERALIETGWPPRQLELEITETALMEDPRAAAALLHRIAALGVRLAVDDFGTGYSSLAYLKDYPLNRLKVDRLFVQGLQISSSDRAIASSIIQLAHALGLLVTAEGIETSQQRDFLVQQQCDELQGFLFSAPISAAACEKWLVPDHPAAIRGDMASSP